LSDYLKRDKNKKRKKLTQAKYKVLLESLLSGLNNDKKIKNKNEKSQKYRKQTISRGVSP